MFSYADVRNQAVESRAELAGAWPSIQPHKSELEVLQGPGGQEEETGE